MRIIGRREEQKKLDAIVQSGRPEFVVVYGRRRIGKTYLIGEYFGNCFAFRAPGLAKGSMAEQLTAFGDRLYEFGFDYAARPKTWLEAFGRLRELLEGDGVSRYGTKGRRIVFIDEMPWFDTPRSGFKTALEYFWNGWGCTQEDLILIVCGSSTSWLIENLLESTEGLYDRVTRVIDLQPFTLAECQEYYAWSGVEYSVRQVVESYMVFGGVPYYLSLQERGLSLAQNVDALLFRRAGQLVMEFDRLFATLFRNPEPFERVVRQLAVKRDGMTRSEISTVTDLSGNALTKTLKKLEQCGFIRGFKDFTKRKKGMIYQLIDPFTLFWLTHIDRGRLDGWMDFMGTPGYYAWAGLSFELVCLLHVDAIKQTLGISGVQTNVSAWRSRDFEPAAQIDLLIDRRDGIINLCEMKYADGPYVLRAVDERSIRNKVAAFRAETGTRKAIHPVLVTLDGATHNAHFNSIILKEVVVGDWLKPMWVD